MNPWAIKAEAEDWVDTYKVASASTWTPRKEPAFEDAAPFDVEKESEIPDRIDFLIPIRMIKGS